METDHADRVAMLRDARKQRYFLPHPHDTIASQPKSHVIYGPDKYYGAVGVIDLHADMALNTGTPEASVVHAQREDLVVPSAEPVLVASPIASDSHSSTPAFPPANDTASTLPSKATLDKAADLIVYDAQGQAVPFKELYQVEPGQRRRVMIIFIRHFFCGNCQEFLRSLASQISPTSLPANASIAIIGCGSHTLIPSYVELTSCPYPIYADPAKRLFDVLGMQRSLSLGWNAPNYIQHTLAAGVVKSIVQGVKRIPAGDVMKAGDLSQNGGEYLFEVEGADTRSTHREAWSKIKGNAGLNVQVTFCHRMRNTRDHTEIPRLVELLGSSDSDERSRRPPSRPGRRWTSGGAIGNLARSLSNRSQNWLGRSSSSSWPSTRKHDRSRSSNVADTGNKNAEMIETVQEDVKSGDGQRSADETKIINAIALVNGPEADAAKQRFSFEEKQQ